MIFLFSFFLHAAVFTSLSIGCSVHMMACLQNTRHFPWCKSRNSYCLRLQLPTISHSFWCHIVLASSISKRRDGTFCCCRHIFFSLLVHAIVVRRHRCRLWSLQWQCSCRMSSVKWEKVVAEDETKQQEAFACMKLCLRTDIKYDKFQRATFSAPFCYSARLLHRLDAHMRHTIRRHEDAHKRHHAVATHTHCCRCPVTVASLFKRVDWEWGRRDRDGKRVGHKSRARHTPPATSRFRIWPKP